METKLRKTKTDSPLSGRMGAQHLSQIREESDSRELSTCVLPPIAPSGVTGEVQEEVPEFYVPSGSSLPLSDRQRQEDRRSLLEELTHIEAELRESLRLDAERQQEAEFLRQQDNEQQWKQLQYLSLSQRVSKPWVSSYFRRFPMHIYCLPVQAEGHKGSQRRPKKR